jgi:NADH-quinone oxidoreductase subunit N
VKPATKARITSDYGECKALFPGGLLWLVILAIGLSAVSLYYYLQVLKQIFVAPESKEGRPHVTPVPVTQQVVLGLVAAMVIGLGCLPQWLIEKLTGAVELVAR